MFELMSRGKPSPDVSRDSSLPVPSCTVLVLTEGNGRHISNVPRMMVLDLAGARLERFE